MAIPKIAHFHWTGPRMSWLRGMSILTFKKFNPTWEIRIHDTPPDIRAHNLPFFGQEADWTWWRKLYEDGGFMVATDVISVAPVPDDYLKGEIAATTNGLNHVFQFAVLGCEKNHPFMALCVKACERIAASKIAKDYQDMGVNMLYGLAGRLPPVPALVEIPSYKYCPIQWNEPERFWETENDIEVRPDVIGYHWFGGAEICKRLEWDAGPDSPYAICKLARQVYEDK